MPTPLTDAWRTMTEEEQLDAYGYLPGIPADPDEEEKVDAMLAAGPPISRVGLDWHTMTEAQVAACTPQEKAWMLAEAEKELQAHYPDPERRPKKPKSKRRKKYGYNSRGMVGLRVLDPDLSQWLVLREGAEFIEYLVGCLRATGQVDLIEGKSSQSNFRLRLHEDDLAFLKNDLGGPANFVKILGEIKNYGRYTVTGKERKVAR